MMNARPTPWGAAALLVLLSNAGMTRAQAPAAPARPPQTGSAGQPAPEPAPPSAPAQPQAPQSAPAPPVPAQPAPAPAPAPAEAAPQPPAAAPPAQPVPPAVQPAEAAPPDAIEPAPEPDVEAPAPTEEMVITGTRIKRTSFAAAAPVAVVDRTQLEYSGAQNLGDVIQYLTAASGSDFAGRGQGMWGTSQVNLRGLGPQATLVLINGRRVVPTGGVSGTGSGVGSVVDIGQIPITAIERIEILRVGASAIYGSDAVAGVVNVITRRDFKGMRVEASAHSSDKFDHAEYVASGTLGASADNARVNLSFNYTRQTDLLSRERDFTRGHNIGAIGNPATFIFDPTNSAISSNRGPGELEPGVHPDPDCEQVERAEIDADNFCTLDNRGFSDLVDARERISALGYGEYDLSEHTFVFAELGVSSVRNQTRIPPSFPVLQEVYVPFDHIDNPWDVTVQYFGAPLPDSAGADRVLGEDDTLRVAAGIAGDFADVAEGTLVETWEWEVLGTWGRSRFRGLVPELVAERVQTALNSCSNPDDLSRCFNPFYTAVTGDGTPNSTAVFEGFRGDMQWVNDSWLTTAEAGLTGSLFELPGGDFEFALGAQYRFEQRASDVDQDANQLRYGFVLGNSDGRASRDIGSAYLELLWPLYDGIELQTAGRLERYEGTGSAVSPSAGAVITPAEIVGRERVVDGLRRLRLRGHVTSAFRAPSVYESFPGFVTSIGRFAGEGNTPVFRPIRLFGNPDVEPEKSLGVSGGFEWSPIKELALTADYWNYDYEHRIIAANALQIYMSDPDDPRIERDSGGRLQRVNVRGDNAAFVRTHGIDAGAIIKIDLDDSGVTAAEAGTVTLAAEATYVLGFEIPRALVADITLQNDPDDDTDDETIAPEDCDSDSCDVVGRRNIANFAQPIPRLRMNIPLSYVYADHALSFVVHYIGGYEDDGTPDPDTGAFPEVDEFVTLDFTYGYTFKELIGAATTLRVGVLNLLDTDPPFVEAMNGYDAETHDPRGRLIYAKLTQEF